MLERGELEYSAAEADTKHYLEQYAALQQTAVIESVCSCSKGKGIDYDEDGKAYCIDCGNYLEQIFFTNQ